MDFLLESFYCEVHSLKRVQWIHLPASKATLLSKFWVNFSLTFAFCLFTMWTSHCQIDGLDPNFGFLSSESFLSGRFVLNPIRFGSNSTWNDFSVTISIYWLDVCQNPFINWTARCSISKRLRWRLFTEDFSSREEALTIKQLSSRAWSS